MYISHILTLLFAFSAYTTATKLNPNSNASSNLSSNSNLPNLPSLTSSGQKCCKDDHTITITGNGSMMQAPNIITIGFTVDTINNDALNAYNENTKISNNVSTLLTAQNNIPQNNITTTEFSITKKEQSVYHEANRTYTNEFKGYEVKNKIEVKLTDFKVAMNLIDQLMNNGVKEIDYVNFDIDSNTKKQIKEQLLANAVLDANNKATILANNANLNIVDVKSITAEKVVIPPPTPLIRTFSAMANAAAAPAEAPKIFSGQNEITVNVNVVYIVKKSQ